MCSLSFGWVSIRAIASLGRLSFQPVYPDSGDPLHEECLGSASEPKLHEFYQRDVTCGMRSLWTLLVVVVFKILSGNSQS